MARLLSHPVGLPVVSLQPLSGPRAVASSASQSISGFTQTTALPFGLWRWQIVFAAMHKAMFRRYRGWVTALHGGANATRWLFFDPDMMSPRDTGIDVAPHVEWTSLGYDQNWSNGMPWSNGQGWGKTPPQVAVAAPAERDDTIVSLSSTFWGHTLDVGDYLGFLPFHMGLYTVTEVFEPGRYRVWPPLRKAISADDFATLRPTLAMRLESEDSASAGRGLVVADGLSVTMVEVLDYDVRQYFTD